MSPCFQPPVRNENVNPAKVPCIAATAGQIVLRDLVFSIDSIITAAGMTGSVPITNASGVGFHFPNGYI
jgi:predicted tellurium resistance membrane protein TerC